MKKDERRCRRNAHEIRAIALWQITLPLSGLGMFAIACTTAVQMTDGRFIFQMEATPERLRLGTEVHKQDDGKSAPCLELPEAEVLACDRDGEQGTE